VCTEQPNVGFMQQWIGNTTQNSSSDSVFTEDSNTISGDADIERVTAGCNPSQKRAIDTYLSAVCTQDHVLQLIQGTCSLIHALHMFHSTLTVSATLCHSEYCGSVDLRAMVLAFI
jgi:hypothetical protein